MTLDDLRRAAELLPEGASLTVSRDAVLDAIKGPSSWRERLWTCADATRLSVPEVADALGRPLSWVYRAVAEGRGVHRLPAQRLSGELVFTASEVRAWIERESEAA